MASLPPPPEPPESPFPVPLLFKIENLVYKEKRIMLDGYRFKNCAFVNCILHTSTGNFRIEECFFQGDWWVHFSGNAANIVKLMSILDLSEFNPSLKAVVHPNGGISII